MKMRSMLLTHEPYEYYTFSLVVSNRHSLSHHGDERMIEKGMQEVEPTKLGTV